MSDIVDKINTLSNQIAKEGMICRAAEVRAAAIEIERLRIELALVKASWQSYILRRSSLASQLDDGLRDLGADSPGSRDGPPNVIVGSFFHAKEIKTNAL